MRYKAVRYSFALASACAFTDASLEAAGAQSAGAAASPVPAAAPSVSPALVEIIETDPGQILHARVGQTFALALRANRATGFAWELAELPAPSVQTIGSAYESRTAAIGGGQSLWLFRAVAPGSATLSLRYVRASEKGSSLMERAVNFRVDIAP